MNRLNLKRSVDKKYKTCNVYHVVQTEAVSAAAAPTAPTTRSTATYVTAGASTYVSMDRRDGSTTAPAIRPDTGCRTTNEAVSVRSRSVSCNPFVSLSRLFNSK